MRAPLRETMPAILEMRYEYNGDNLPLYQGYAIPESAEAATVWTVIKYTYDGTNMTKQEVKIDVAWSNRASLDWDP